MSIIFEDPEKQKAFDKWNRIFRVIIVNIKKPLLYTSEDFRIKLHVFNTSFIGEQCVPFHWRHSLNIPFLMSDDRLSTITTSPCENIHFASKYDTVYLSRLITKYDTDEINEKLTELYQYIIRFCNPESKECKDILDIKPEITWI